MSDPVHSPDHYRWLPVEVIDITEHLGFCMGNVVKYVLRADHKGKPIEDLKKARWYLDREIARREAQSAAPETVSLGRFTAPPIETQVADLAEFFDLTLPEAAQRLARAAEEPLKPFQTPHNARYDDEQHVRGEE